MKLAGDANGAIVTQALRVGDVIADAGAQYQAELLDFLIGNLLLGKTKQFPMPPEVVEPARGAIQHAVSGTQYKQTPPNRRSTLARIFFNSWDAELLPVLLDTSGNRRFTTTSPTWS